MATYGDFPGVRVTTQSGGISSLSIGAEEKLVIFGEASYNASDEVAGDDTSLDVSAGVPEQINAPRVADDKFGSDSELANGMKEALANGANIEYLYGVAVPLESVSGETQGTQEGALDNVELVDERSHITFDDDGTSLSVEFRYGGAPPVPTDSDTVYINPLTGEYAADSAPATDFAVDYQYNDYGSAFSTEEVRNVINEDETGIYLALSDSDAVSGDLNTEVSDLRNNYQLVNALMFAEPNDSEVLGDSQTDDDNAGADARYDTSNYDSANSSVTEEYFYKFAPARKDGDVETIGGGLGGLFAGNAINDPIYNETLSGYQSLEQGFTKSDADNMRDPDSGNAPAIIPIRSGGSVRVKGNRSTAYHEADTVAEDFWVRRIADRVILIGKLVGDEILGRINDEDTRTDAERAIASQMRQLSSQRLIQPNTENENNWSVNVYEDETNPNEVNIDIAFTPYGIVKRVDESITIDTS